MHQSFNEESDEGKLAILRFLKKERFSIYFKITAEGHKYFKKEIPQIYKDVLAGADGEIHLLGFIDDVCSDNDIKVVVLEHCSGDADTTYDDSYERKRTSGMFPNGLAIFIPLEYIGDIQPFRKFGERI